MGHKRFSPKGTPYNETDPLGVIKHEEDIARRLEEPNPVQLFIENEAKKKDEARRLRPERPTKYQLLLEYMEVVKKLYGMVVTFETKSGYKRGRITGIGNSCLKVSLRGTKEEMWVDFEEVLKLSQNYP